MNFLIIISIPLIIAFCGFIFYKRQITFLEMLAQMGAIVVVCALFFWGFQYSSYIDTQVMNGRVIEKTRDRVSCRHSYSCNCREICSGSGKDRSCHTHCDTCYEHSYDIDWNVRSNIGSTSINTIDRQGLKEPSRWTSVIIGEPFSTTSWYQNYVKGHQESLFSFQSDFEKFKEMIPEYPKKVYDYYRIDRVLSVRANISDLPVWNKALSEVDADLGPSKQCNAVIIFVKGQTEQYFYALQKYWINGKKNDVITVIGVDDQNNVLWVNVMGWSYISMYQIKIRDGLKAMGSITGRSSEVASLVKNSINEGYRRKSFKDFEYLKDNEVFAAWQWVLLMIVGIGLSIFLMFVFKENDIEYSQQDEPTYPDLNQRRK